MFTKKLNTAKNYSEKKLYKKMLELYPVGLPDLGSANTGPEGPAGSQGSAP